MEVDLESLKASKLDIWSKCLINWIRQPRVMWVFGRQILLESECWRKKVGGDFMGGMRRVSQAKQRGR